VTPGGVDLFQVGHQLADAQVLTLLLEHLAVSDDRVEGGAQLVAHVGQELALGLVGDLRRLLRHRQLLGAPRQLRGELAVALHLLAEAVGVPSLPLGGEPLLHLPLLRQPQLLRLPLDLLGLAVQVDERRHLRTQDLGHERLEQEVDRPDAIPLDNRRLRPVVSGEENDRRVPRPLPVPDEPRRLEPVHPRHLHVEQDDGKVLPQQLLEGLRPRMRFDHPRPQARKEGFQGKQVLRPVVDHQDVRGRDAGRGGVGGRGGAHGMVIVKVTASRKNG
jgi:hypothetical protein